MTTIPEIHPCQVIHPSRGRIVSVEWSEHSKPPHEFLVVLCPEEEGGFSVFAPYFPGVVSQGETKDEAEQNIREAFQAMFEACKKLDQPVAYSPSPTVEIGPDWIRSWVVVDA